MLTIYTPAGAVPLHIDNYYIKELYSGYDELIFDVDIFDPEYLLIQEESLIREESDAGPILYLVKAIDGGGQTAKIKCQIDLDAWKTTLTKDYNSGSLSVGAIAHAIRPTGWTVIDHSGKTYQRTIELPGATPLDVLEACRTTFDVTFRFDNIRKILEIVNPDSFTPLGAFLTRDLNLKEINYFGKSTSFATRLYAYGKDGLSFADINDGKAYVENHDYSARVICAFWEDDRFTVKENLLQAAQEKIDEMAVPARSYECKIVDLAAVDPEKYGFQDFSLFSVVTLIDTNRNAGKVDHQIVEVWRYPYQPEKNSVVLSTVAPRIQSQVSQIIYNMTNPNSDYQGMLLAAQLQATADILGAKGGAVRLLDTNDDGYPDTLYIADDPDPEQATFVWRFNYMGWGASTNGFDGPFEMAATINAGIVADYITAGTMLADRIKGGTLELGGSNNISGQIAVKNSSGFSFATLDNTGLVIRNSSWGTVISNGSYYLYDYTTGQYCSYDSISYRTVQNKTYIQLVKYVKEAYTIYSYMLNKDVFAFWPYGFPGVTETYWYLYDTLAVGKNLNVYGTKNRIVKTKDYGERLLYSYEMPSPMFGDLGEGEIGEDGSCYVWLDPVFAETITTDQYQVFLQKYGAGDLYISDRKAGYFVVTGTPGLRFGWELKAKQADFDQRRLDKKINEGAGSGVDYGGDAAEYYQKLMEGRIAA